MHAVSNLSYNFIDIAQRNILDTEIFNTNTKSYARHTLLRKFWSNKKAVHVSLIYCTQNIRNVEINYTSISTFLFCYNMLESLFMLRHMFMLDIGQFPMTTLHIFVTS